MADQPFGWVIAAAYGDADRGGDRKPQIAHRDLALDRRGDPLGDPGGLGQVHVLAEQDELIAAEAGYGVPGT